MPGTQIDQMSTHFLVGAANITTATVTEPVSTTTPPANSTNGNVFAFAAGGEMTSPAAKFFFFGEGADANTFTAYVYGWEVAHSGESGVPDLWVPVLLATFTSITLDSAQPGVAGTQIPATGPNATAQYLATAITLGVGNSGISCEVVSPGHASHEIAHAVVATKGAKFIEFRFATGSSATSCNVAISRR